MDTTIPESRGEKEFHPVPVRCALKTAMYYKDAYTIGCKNAFFLFAGGAILLL